MRIDSDFSLPVVERPSAQPTPEANASPEELLHSLKEHHRLYQVLKETGLIHEAKAKTIQEELKTAIADLESMIKNFKEEGQNV